MEREGESACGKQHKTGYTTVKGRGQGRGLSLLTVIPSFSLIARPSLLSNTPSSSVSSFLTTEDFRNFFKSLLRSLSTKAVAAASACEEKLVVIAVGKGGRGEQM
jgi:hypothetical protein